MGGLSTAGGTYMAHDHSHAHDHAHGPASYNRAFAIGVALNLIFVAVEAVYGVLSGSLALLADAGHNLSDVLGLLLAWGASVLAQQASSRQRTFGLKKSTILAALLNALILLFAIGGIAWEAIRRFADPVSVSGSTVIWVAFIGIVINTATMLLFMADRERDLNIRGAFLHMAADAAVSLGVVIAGIVILFTDALWVDPVVSLVIAIVIFFGTWSLLKDSVNLAVDAVPKGIDSRTVAQRLTDIEGVESVHDLHIWGMSTTETALMAHLVKPSPDNDERVIERATTLLNREFGIDHVTLQLERRTGVCPSDAQC